MMARHHSFAGPSDLEQAQKIEQIFKNADLQVIGLHTVFEHHAAMTPVALQAFLHEYRIGHPVGVDQPGQTGFLPVTMERYQFQGTPSAVIIGRDGAILHQKFGTEDDMIVGARIASALAMPVPVSVPVPEIQPVPEMQPVPQSAHGCTDGLCPVPA